ncbi:MAG: VWA domain-containing protein [Chloroflexota bacterium]
MPADRTARNLLVLPRLLRRAQLPVDAGRARAFLAAVAEIDVWREEDVRAAARATLVANPADLARFDATFDVFIDLLLGRVRPVDTGAQRPPLDARGLVASPLDARGHDAPSPARREAHRAASSHEVLRTKDFAKMSSAERTAAATFLERLVWSPGFRKGRRRRRSRRGDSYDLRATLRRSLRTLGEPLFLQRRSARPRPRPLVVICDVSGSMEPYVRLMLHMTHAFTRSWGRVEVFTLGTRLTRVTRRLRQRRADAALSQIASDVRDWSGGTRIAESLRAFNRIWSRRVLGRGAIVLLVTDGWEQGDAVALVAEAERLQRTSYRLVWLDPLAGTPGYAAVSAGARALASRTDDHLAANTLQGLEGMADALAGGGRGRPVRRAASHRDRI